MTRPAGRVKGFQNLTGRVGSGQEVSKYHGSVQVGSQEICLQNLADRVGS